jgi:hypothetical protein
MSAGNCGVGVDEPYRIEENAWYDDYTASRLLGLRYGPLEKARKAGALRFTKRGGRVLYLGRWIADWLTGDSVTVSHTSERLGDEPPGVVESEAFERGPPGPGNPGGPSPSQCVQATRGTR